jgi:hypothetical protein
VGVQIRLRQDWNSIFKTGRFSWLIDGDERGLSVVNNVCVNAIKFTKIC